MQAEVANVSRMTSRLVRCKLLAIVARVPLARQRRERDRHGGDERIEVADDGQRDAEDGGADDDP